MGFIFCSEKIITMKRIINVVIVVFVIFVCTTLLERYIGMPNRGISPAPKSWTEIGETIPKRIIVFVGMGIYLYYLVDKKGKK